MTKAYFTWNDSEVFARDNAYLPERRWFIPLRFETFGWLIAVIVPTLSNG